MLELTLRGHCTIPIDFTGIGPDSMRHDTAARAKILLGNQLVEIGELFIVKSIAGSKPGLVLEGDCSCVHSIGAGLTSDTMIVHGHAGRHAGAGMKGGSLRITGNAGDWLGADMTGGIISVGGDVGDFAGAASPGRRRGMSGGSITIEGNAGRQIGSRMRRGIIQISGDCGQFAGASMIAGTISVGGRIGDNPGAGMRRGTLILRGPLPKLAPGFSFACEYEPVWLRMLQRGRSVRCYRGDLLTGGRGEIWQVIA